MKRHPCQYPGCHVRTRRPPWNIHFGVHFYLCRDHTQQLLNFLRYDRLDWDRFEIPPAFQGGNEVGRLRYRTWQPIINGFRERARYAEMYPLMNA